MFKNLQFGLFGFLLALNVVFFGQACMPKTEVASLTEKVLVFEQRVRSQVDRVDVVFSQLLTTLPEAERAIALAEFAKGKIVLANALDAKDACLQAIHEGTKTEADLTQLVGYVVQAVQSVISVVGAFGADKDFVRSETVRSMSLRGGV